MGTYKNNTHLPQSSVGSCFFRRNEFPTVIHELWEKTPKEGQRVEVDYGTSTNNNVWWIGGKFVNKYGFDLFNILGWRDVK